MFFIRFVRDFMRFFNPIHGNCFAFNSGWNSSVELKTSTKSGMRHGWCVCSELQERGL